MIFCSYFHSSSCCCCLETFLQRQCIPEHRGAHNGAQYFWERGRTQEANEWTPHNGLMFCTACSSVAVSQKTSGWWYNVQLKLRGGRYDQNLISRYSDFFYVLIILKSLIPYTFHNPCHQCQYQTNTSLKREREKNSTSLKINKQSVMK